MTTPKAPPPQSTRLPALQHKPYPHQVQTVSMFVEQCLQRPEDAESAGMMLVQKAGWGKSRITLGCVEEIHQRYPELQPQRVMIVCPITAVWEEQLKTHYASPVPYVIVGTEQGPDEAQWQSARFVLVTFSTLVALFKRSVATSARKEDHAAHLMSLRQCARERMDDGDLYDEEPDEQDDGESSQDYHRRVHANDYARRVMTCASSLLVVDECDACADPNTDTFHVLTRRADAARFVLLLSGTAFFKKPGTWSWAYSRLMRMDVPTYKSWLCALQEHASRPASQKSRRAAQQKKWSQSTVETLDTAMDIRLAADRLSQDELTRALRLKIRMVQQAGLVLNDEERAVIGNGEEDAGGASPPEVSAVEEDDESKWGLSDDCLLERGDDDGSVLSDRNACVRAYRRVRDALLSAQTTTVASVRTMHYDEEEEEEEKESLPRAPPRSEAKKKRRRRSDDDDDEDEDDESDSAQDDTRHPALLHPDVFLEKMMKERVSYSHGSLDMKIVYELVHTPFLHTAERLLYLLLRIRMRAIVSRLHGADASVRRKLEGWKRTHLVMLRMACMGGAAAIWSHLPELGLPQPRHDDAPWMFASSRMLAFGEQLRRHVKRDGENLLVFSSFLVGLSLAEVVCEAEGVPYGRIDGSVPVPERNVLVRRFATTRGMVLLASHGTMAKSVNGPQESCFRTVFLEPHYNPLDQPLARTARLGQKNPIVYASIHVCRDTYEERMLSIANWKCCDTVYERIRAGDLQGLLRSSGVVAAGTSKASNKKPEESGTEQRNLDSATVQFLFDAAPPQPKRSVVENRRVDRKKAVLRDDDEPSDDEGDTDAPSRKRRARGRPRLDERMRFERAVLQRKRHDDKTKTTVDSAPPTASRLSTAITLSERVSSHIPDQYAFVGPAYLQVLFGDVATAAHRQSQTVQSQTRQALADTGVRASAILAAKRIRSMKNDDADSGGGPDEDGHSTARGDRGAGAAIVPATSSTSSGSAARPLPLAVSVALPVVEETSRLVSRLFARPWTHLSPLWKAASRPLPSSGNLLVYRQQTPVPPTSMGSLVMCSMQWRPAVAASGGRWAHVRRSDPLRWIAAAHGNEKALEGHAGVESLRRALAPGSDLWRYATPSGGSVFCDLVRRTLPLVFRDNALVDGWYVTDDDDCETTALLVVLHPSELLTYCDPTPPRSTV